MEIEELRRFHSSMTYTRLINMVVAREKGLQRSQQSWDTYVGNVSGRKGFVFHVRIESDGTIDAKQIEQSTIPKIDEQALAAVLALPAEPLPNGLPAQNFIVEFGRTGSVNAFNPAEFKSAYNSFFWSIRSDIHRLFRPDEIRQVLQEMKDEPVYCGLVIDRQMRAAFHQLFSFEEPSVNRRLKEIVESTSYSCEKWPECFPEQIEYILDFGGGYDVSEAHAPMFSELEEYYAQKSLPPKRD